MTRTTRLRLFIRDWLSEFGCAWSIARMRDCDRMGGHLWSEPHVDGLLGYSQTCSRCGCGQSIRTTTATTTSTASNLSVSFSQQQ